MTHFDAEGGAEAIAHRDGSRLEIVELFTYADFEFACEVIKKGPQYHGRKSFTFDNMTEIMTQCIRSITGSWEKQPTQPEWGTMARKFLGRVRDLRDYARRDGVNIFLNVWDSDEKDDTGVLKKHLAFTPKLREEFPGILTTIGHVGVRNDPDTRQLDFAPSPRSVSKFRRMPGSDSTRIPHKIEYGLSNLPLPYILDVLRGGANWPADKFKPKSGQA